MRFGSASEQDPSAQGGQGQGGKTHPDALPSLPPPETTSCSGDRAVISPPAPLRPGGGASHHPALPKTAFPTSICG